MPEIQLKNVRKVYRNGVYALDGVSISIEQGDFVSVAGASGCGKTTLLKCIAGLEPITAGELLIAGEIANGTRVQERKVGIVFQEFTLYPHMSVFENIAFALKKQKLPYDEMVMQTRDIMDRMGLADISAQIPRELSYGQKQKVALARALVKEPDIILFDEPLSNIDEVLKREYRQFIVRTKELFPDSTFLYVTHNIQEAMSMGNKLAVMDKGKVIQYGAVRQLYEYPCNRLVLETLHQNVVYADCVVTERCVVAEEEKIELSTLQQVGLQGDADIPAVCAKYDGYMSCFDADGNAILGVPDKVCFPIEVDADSISICGRRFPADPIADGLLGIGSGTAVLAQQSFRFSGIPNSIELAGTVLFYDSPYLCAEVSGTRMVLAVAENYRAGDKILLYYPLTEMELYDKAGNRMLAQYALTDNVIEAKVLSARKGIVKIGGRKLRFGQELPQKKVRLQFSRDAFLLTSDRKRGLEISVLNEEYWNGRTLVYAEIKGGQSYLVMELEGRVRSFARGKVYVVVDMEKAAVVG